MLSRAVADGPSSDDELWYTPEQLLLPVQELAARFDDAQSQRILCIPPLSTVGGWIMLAVLVVFLSRWGVSWLVDLRQSAR